jgi:hypothetical protein
MIFNNSNLVKVLSIGLLIQNSNVNAFDLSDVTNAVDQVNSVAKQLNAPQPIPSIPTPQVTTIPAVISETPKEFQGKWVTNQKNCVGNPDSGVVEIEKNRFYGYEWSAVIKSTKSLGKKLEVVFTTASDGDESSETSKQTWELNGAGNSLSIFDSTGGVEKYSRCGSVGLATRTPVIVDKEVLFSCKTKKGKIINLTKSKNTIQYSFGYPNKKPEMVIDTPIGKADTFSGVHGDVGVNLVKGNLTYAVGFMRPSFEEEGNTLYGEFWGVIVTDTKSDKEIAKVECDVQAYKSPPDTEALFKFANSSSE